MRKLKRFLGGRLFPCVLLIFIFAATVGAVAVFLPRFLAPLAAAERLFSFGTGVFVAGGRELPESKTSKLLLLVLLPWAGAALCLVFFPKKPASANRNVCAPAEDLFSACANLSHNLCGEIPVTADSAEYFPVGREMYERLLCDLANAKKFIYLEYYIIAEGKFWNDVMRLLEEKAKAGLDVRVRYDDFGCALTLPRGFKKTLRKKGISCEIFREIKFPFRGIGRRDHRKIAVVDGEIAYTGGINLADEYIGETLRFGHWKDTALRVTGAPAMQFANLFLGKSNQTAQSAAPQGTGAPCVLFYDGDGRERAGEQIFSALLYGAKRYVHAVTPNLAPSHVFMQALKSAAARGADVRILVPHVPDKRAVFLLTLSYAHELKEAGVEVREYTAGFAHAKNLGVDGQLGVVSSYNLDFRSMYLQAECGALIKDEPFADALERDFAAMWEGSSPLTALSGGKKFLCGILRLFAPLV